MKRSILLPILQATLAVTFWGASFVATKVALRYVAPVTLVWLRFAMGLAVLGIVMATRKQFQLPRRAEIPYLVLLGLIGITFHQWLQSNGLLTAQATTSSWIVATGPVFIALLGWIALKEKLTAFQSAGVVLAMLGVLLIVTRGDLAALTGGQGITPGDVLVMISAPNWAVFSVLSRRGLKQHPAARMMFFVMAFGWLGSTALFLLDPQLPAALPVDGWWSVLFLGVFCSGLAYIFWYDAMKVLPASQVGVFLYIEPLVTVLVAWVLLGERLTWASILGGAVILAGVGMVNKKGEREEGEKGKRRKERDDRRLRLDGTLASRDGWFFRMFRVFHGEISCAGVVTIFHQWSTVNMYGTRDERHETGMPRRSRIPFDWNIAALR